MKVSICYEHGLNIVVKSAIYHAILKRYLISFQFSCATLYVPDFPTFLECMWVGFSECSKSSLGDQMRRVYTMSVTTDDGNSYGVWVRYDEESCGIRYGSVR